MLTDEDRKRLFYRDREREAKTRERNEKVERHIQHVGKRLAHVKHHHHSSKQPFGFTFGSATRIPR